MGTAMTVCMALLKLQGQPPSKEERGRDKGPPPPAKCSPGYDLNPNETLAKEEVSC